MIVDALGLPVAFEVTPGNVNDCEQAASLIETVKPACLLADKGYDTDAIRKQLADQNALTVIPSKANRKHPAPLDTELYKARCEVECRFSWLKQARRFATRYEKTLRNYVAVVAIRCSLAWLRI